MQFHQPNNRRRRLLADDLSGGNASAQPMPAPSRTYRRIDGYAPAAKIVQQRRVVELLPRTYLSASVWLSAGVLAIIGLAAAQICLPTISARLTTRAAAPLDMAVRGSLAAWLESLWLIVAAALSLLIYSIRRHKLDDYRGRYRWWLLAAGVWFVMSMDAACGVHQLFVAMMVHLTTYIGPADGAMWWLGAWGILLGGLSARLAWEMRVCRHAMWSYLSAIALWAAGIAIQTSGVRPGAIGNVLAAGVAILVGQLTLLFALGVYARHVMLHAQGLLPRRKRRSSKSARNAKSPSAASGEGARSDLAPHVRFSAGEQADAESAVEPETRSQFHGSSMAKPAVNVSAPSGSSLDDSSDADSQSADDGDQTDGGDRKLSKAERKRLRKLRARDEQGW